MVRSFFKQAGPPKAHRLHKASACGLRPGRPSPKSCAIIKQSCEFWPVGTNPGVNPDFTIRLNPGFSSIRVARSSGFRSNPGQPGETAAATLQTNPGVRAIRLFVHRKAFHSCQKVNHRREKAMYVCEKVIHSSKKVMQACVRPDGFPDWPNLEPDWARSPIA